MEYRKKIRRLISLILFPICLAGCTLSFQNISTHGTATDLVDEEQAASPTVSPKISAVPM